MKNLALNIRFLICFFNKYDNIKYNKKIEECQKYRLFYKSIDKIQLIIFEIISSNFFLLRKFSSQFD